MREEVSTFADRLVTEEIRRIVAAAIHSNSVLSANLAAKLVIQTYPNCSYSFAEIVNEIVIAAARSGIAVEIGEARAAPRRASNVNSAFPDRKAG